MGITHISSEWNAFIHSIHYSPLAYGIFFDANLCGISEKEELAVSSARHRAVMEISEEGVEAAAATAVSLARTANFFEVQQPFIFAVVNEKRLPIFMGRINNPQAWTSSL